MCHTLPISGVTHSIKQQARQWRHPFGVVVGPPAVCSPGTELLSLWKTSEVRSVSYGYTCLWRRRRWTRPPAYNPACAPRRGTRMRRLLCALLAVVSLMLVPQAGLVSQGQYSPANAAIESAAGAGPAAISASMDAFRSDLGGNNNAAGNPTQGGRREINWDGVPDTVAAPNLLPVDFFNKNSARGVVFATSGSGVEVSANDGVAPVRFADVNPSYSNNFSVFSAQRLFAPLGSNTTDATFFVPGTTTPATVSGFGAVFTNVQIANSTTIEYFDAQGASLGVFAAPVSPAAGLSFLGVSFAGNPSVGHVRITTGNAALGASTSDGYGTNVVAMDDLIYGEPVAMP
jgi:hypothetical protein